MEIGRRLRLPTALPRRAGRAIERAARSRRAWGFGATAAAVTGIAAAGRDLLRRRGAAEDEVAYRLHRRERLGIGARRIAAARVDDAIEVLGSGTDDAIHEARKDLKKTRSLLRLVRDELGESIYRLENSHYRDIARSLSGLRDAEAIAEALAALRERYGLASDRFAELEPRLASSGDQTGANGPRQRAARALAAGRVRITGWPVLARDWRAAEPGLRRAYRRGRKRFADARESPDDTSLHEWRKRVKDLWYQARLLRERNPKKLAPLADELHRLSDLLGDDHDLAQVRERAAALEGPPGAAELIELAERRRGELQLEAFELGQRLYAAKPREFTDSVL